MSGGDQPDLELTPTSARVQRGTRAMTRPMRRAAALGAPRIRLFEAEILPDPVDIAHIDPDPAHMARLKVTLEPRAVERPDEMWDQLRERTPQFTLRNTERLERFADAESLDLLEWRRLRDDDWREVIQMAHRGGARRPEVMPETASRRLAAQVAESRVLMVETRWHEHFGRPDPLIDP